MPIQINASILARNHQPEKTTMKILIISTAILLLALISYGCIIHGKFEMTEIDKAIELVKSETHKKFLLDFKSQYLDSESILVTSNYKNFEIIVSHKSTAEYTGGAEQYFLDKKTGEIKMGWHEAPMKTR